MKPLDNVICLIRVECSSIREAFGIYPNYKTSYVIASYLRSGTSHFTL
jgi:hypothetical protein